MTALSSELSSFEGFPRAEAAAESELTHTIVEPALRKRISLDARERAPGVHELRPGPARWQVRSSPDRRS